MTQWCTHCLGTKDDLYDLSDLDIQDGCLKLNILHLKKPTKLSHHTILEVNIFIRYEIHP